MIVLPKPIKAHIKDVNNLTEYERQLYEKELAEAILTVKEQNAPSKDELEKISWDGLCDKLIQFWGE